MPPHPLFFYLAIERCLLRTRCVKMSRMMTESYCVFVFCPSSPPCSMAKSPTGTTSPAFGCEQRPSRPPIFLGIPTCAGRTRRKSKRPLRVVEQQEVSTLLPLLKGCFVCHISRTLRVGSLSGWLFLLRSIWRTELITLIRRGALILWLRKHQTSNIFR